MSSPVPAIEANDAEEPSASADGWRSGGLPALRAELDRIDNAIHTLLIERAQVVEHVARTGKPAAFRPGREASIIRRLLARHRGALPPVALVRIWRELLAGTTSMQGGFSMAVCDPADGMLTPLAREHFGALTPLRAHARPDQVLAEVSQGKASVAVLPYPSDDNGWWVALLYHQPQLHIVARLPFWKPRPEGFPPAQALVVAAAPPDASEADRSFLGLECDNDTNPARLHSELAAAGFEPTTIAQVRTPKSVNVLVEVSGLLADTDPRLTRLAQVLRPPVVLGGYAVPLDGVVS